MIKIFKYSSLLIALALGLQAEASRNLSEKRKEIHKHYDVNQKVLLTVSNQFGKIHIENWDKNEMDVKVEVIARGRSDEQAERLLQKISIDIGVSSDEIEFETEITGSSNNQETFEINYKIYMNPNNPIDLENEFGDIYLPFRKGLSEVELSYGSLKSMGATGAFDLELSFGDGEIGPLQEAGFEINYSKVFLTSAKKLLMEQKFSEVEIEEVGDLGLEMKYGELNLAKLSSAAIEGHFSSITIGELSEKLVVEGNYISNFRIQKLKRTFSELLLSGQFSGYDVVLEPGLAADIEAEFSFADLKLENVKADFFYRDVEDNTKEYRGRINGGHPDKKIIISSSYGNLRLSQ